MRISDWSSDVCSSDLIGVLFVLPTLCTALAAPIWGRWADRNGCRLSLLRAHAGLFAGFLLAGFSPNLTVFVLALIIQGTFGGAMAASNAYLSTQFKGGDLSRALNWTQYSEIGRAHVELQSLMRISYA